MGRTRLGLGVPYSNQMNCVTYASNDVRRLISQMSNFCCCNQVIPVESESHARICDET
jgi:hypothetical protein